MGQQTGQGPQLPVDGSGKITGSFYFTDPQSGKTIYLPSTVLVDQSGREIRLSDLIDSQALLVGIATRLDIIAAAIDKNYEPPDELTDI